jgi:hypothetical protein
MKSLFYSYDMGVQRAYIIRVKNHAVSEAKAATCAASCQEVGMPYEFWDAYDGTGDTIKPPAKLIGHPTMACLKVTDHYLTRSELCCALSHISLWAKCVEDDKPLVILEHDAIMVKPYLQHALVNSICYLGAREQVQMGWGVYPTPPHGSEGPNYHFILRAHAYAIDPLVAKNMLAYAIKYGINGPLDIMLRSDIFPIHQMGIYAYDAKDDITTITGRPLEGRSTTRNDNMQ